MDTSDKEIVFDEHGNCNHCNDFIERSDKRAYKGERSDKRFVEVVSKIKGTGKNKYGYDCLIGVSGGVDSSYAAYIAKKNGLSPLLVHMDNGWDSEIAAKNIKKICNILGLDYQCHVLDWQEFRDLQLAFLKSSTPEIETPTDMAITGSLHMIAAQYGIKYIISGGNYANEGILPKTWHYNRKDAKYLKYIQNKFGTKRLKHFPYFGWKDEVYYKIIKRIRIVYLLNYVPYIKDDAIKTLENDLGWRYYGGKHYESKYTAFIQSYVLPIKFNIDYRRVTFSVRICTGEISRDYALDELKNRIYQESQAMQEKEYVSKKLGISLGEFENILNYPVKYYYDYPNDDRKLEFIYSVYRKLYSHI